MKNVYVLILSLLLINSVLLTSKAETTSIVSATNPKSTQSLTSSSHTITRGGSRRRPHATAAAVHRPVPQHAAHFVSHVHPPAHHSIAHASLHSKHQTPSAKHHSSPLKKAKTTLRALRKEERKAKAVLQQLQQERKKSQTQLAENAQTQPTTEDTNSNPETDVSATPTEEAPVESEMAPTEEVESMVSQPKESNTISE